jgi:putative serine protease PepD
MSDTWTRHDSAAREAVTGADLSTEAPHRLDPIGPLPPPPGPPPPDVPSARAAPAAGAWRTTVVAAAVAALVAAGVSVPVTLAVTDRATTPEPGVPAAPVDDRPARGSQAPGASVADVADAVLPSVARVDVAAGRGQGSGSAVVYRADGHFITNAHVVGSATGISVTLPDGTSAEAEVVGIDESTDVAVLRVDLADVEGVTELPVPAFADATPRIGETAIAIGSPFGLDGSVTAGVVSAVGRSVPGVPLVDVIQTDAPINPGNSGGALVNDRAEVIGINTAILGGSAAGGGNIGIGFAVPITTALPIAEQLGEKGYVEHGQLGVTGQDVDPRGAQLYGLPVTEGAVIAEVLPGSAADEAGLRRGDIITALDGEPVASMVELGARIRRHAPGDTVTVTYQRGSQEREAEVTLGAAQRR